MELHDKRVVVVGLAQTGVAVAKFCAARGARVVVTDAKDEGTLSERVAALGGCAVLQLGGHDFKTFTTADLIVMSPGVPELPETREARRAGVEVIAEIELAYRFLHPDANLIAITGTNGKSTTTALTGSLCEASGVPTFCGGNLGNHPLIEAVDHPANTAGGYVVAEVAGFMLETCTSFRPRVGACLNITEDHLDRYRTMDVYASMKNRVYRWQTADDYAIANAGDPMVMAGARAAASALYTFDSSPGADATTRRGAFTWRDPDPDSDRVEIVLRLPGGDERYPTDDLRLIGTHNHENAMAAYLAARLCGVSPTAVRTGARKFRPQKHRMELVGEKHGVGYFDDSKGTNVAAVAASMRGFPRPAVLICGGVDKGGSYRPMFEALRGVARGMVLIGEAREIIRESADAEGVSYPVIDARDMLDAVQKATGLCQPGDAVVLSPACSSYDMFKNFGERGMAFRDAVSRIGGTRLDLDAID